MKLIDTHTHLFLPPFSHDREEVIGSAIRNGVVKMLLPDVDSSTTDAVLVLAMQYPDHCLPMIGLHPTSVKHGFETDLARIRNLLEKRKFWGIGETGIDLYRDKTFFNQQVTSFQEHIGLSLAYDLPLIIHCRDSFREITGVLDESGTGSLKGIFHAFTGTAEQAEKIISYGFKMGIGGIVTFKNSGLAGTLKEVDPAHLVLETDSPYLAPVPYRGKRNESSYLVHIVDRLAEIYGMHAEKIAEITTHNAGELFGLDI